ncbi:MAG: hypothetical protein LBI33_14295 [Propionibacteriaceae bacterium]|jgi:pentose-5-phosphate-3-epimerase|nr:hypothetical protein [Propionibacteriaceae bacterium]
MDVRVAEWAGEYAPGVLAASVYALPPADRLAGAVAAHRAGCLIHIDLIVTARAGGFVHAGVTPDEVRAISARVPSAGLDVHVMVAGAPAAARVAALGAVTAVLADANLARVSAAPDLLDALAPALDPGVPLWEVLWPATQPVGVAAGALLMLIPPGTKQQADPARLGVLPGLTAHTPAGVDGGVSRPLADVALGAGATYAVLGRAIFHTQSDNG